MKASTRDRLLETAYRLFYEKGYHGTGIDEILKEAGVHKGSLYHYFKNKKELLLAVIEEVIAANLQAKYAPLSQSEEPLALLFAILNRPVGFDFRHGCALNNLVQEMSPLDEEVAKALQHVYDALEGHYLQALHYCSGPEEEKERLAKMMVATVEGAIMAAKSAQCGDPYFLIVGELEKMVTASQK